VQQYAPPAANSQLPEPADFVAILPRPSDPWLVFSCTGSPGHPYFYHFDNGFAVNNSSNCWTFAEEAGGNSSQFVGTFTNNCSDIEQLSVALACSDTPQPPSD
jgi:hypothetical protein